jgi:hypothetical protein
MPFAPRRAVYVTIYSPKAPASMRITNPTAISATG